ncbi:MAG: hypothetical protein K1W10_01975 [Lachnospiraceae bacterium]
MYLKEDNDHAHDTDHSQQGRNPGLVKTNNIWHTHFSRNPKIEELLKAYSFVKEYGEGVGHFNLTLTRRTQAAERCA